jgi:hypothetical protein
MQEDNTENDSRLDLLEIFRRFFKYEILIDLKVTKMIVEFACECQDNFPGDYFGMSEDPDRKKDMERDLMKFQGGYIPLEKVLAIVENYDMWDINVDIDELESISARLAFINELVKFVDKSLE